ncbi:bifunctional acetate--CoA ligase family protein/GNAT family N-acetyltransferase [Myceligenerans salitolerans]|uniref:GNAT family N-acetyltransferase n=1 Tax=Myceligenerans salitolerans TaxID=1230528 RepID=A0ABS3ICB2_9MICO|nr:GNAT family N-acetyltransferase [Myceligenerans salitolerans]MBO0610677.1 GNAT family N-acetyltransferase [Myceligenerans salitolerans]
MSDDAVGAEGSQVPYPVEWEADVVLRDGSTTHLRPIRPDDADALQRFHMAQSERSVYLRFFAALNRIPERMLRQFVTVDHTDRVALVAVRPASELSDGEEILGVARFDVVPGPGPRTAEVAFNIADSVQGRGLGSVLLEHVADAARERGVRRFVAEVLPQNRAMLGVFREAGYAVEQHLDDGFVHVGIGLDPTDRSREVMADREHRAEAVSMAGLLGARRVLLVGPARIGDDDGEADPHHSLEALQAARVVASHRTDPGDTVLTVLGVAGETAGPGEPAAAAGSAPEAPPTPAVSSPAVVPAASWDDVGDIDLLLVAAPPDRATEAVRRAAVRGARGVVVLSAGYAETGPEGLARQRELLRVAHGAGMRVVGPASYGLVTNAPGARLRASLAEHAPPDGVVGLFCQSAPAAVTLAKTVVRRGLGVSALVSAGHRADVSGNDLMQYWQDDPTTGVVCLYLETLGNPRKFSRVARRLAARKPVVVVVAGRSGHVVPPGHVVRSTRAPRRMLDEVLTQSGVIRAENTHQLMDVAQVAAHQPLPRGRRVGILAGSPTLLTLVSEACGAAGLDVREAVALRPGASDEDVARAVETLYAPDACDAVVVVDVPVVVPRSDGIARAVAAAAARTGRTTVASMLGLHGMPEVLRAPYPAADAVASAPDENPDPRHAPSGTSLTGDGVRVPAFSTPEDAVWALGAVVRYARWREQDHGAPVRPEGVDRARARELVEAALAGSGQEMPLDDGRAAELLACYGIRVWTARTVRSADEAVDAAREIGWPVALKIATPALRHRADLGGVKLDIAEESELRADAARMQAAAGSLVPAVDPALEVQAMAPPGVACVIRSREDDLFGPVVSFGLAGDATDLLDDVSHGVPPLTDVDVARMVRGVRTAPRLFGYQGAPTADVAALEDVLSRVSVMADDLPELASLELYPVTVAEHGASVLHATVRLRPAGRRTDPLRRSLPE